MELSTTRTLGVLGGMGPAATIDFMAKIVAATPGTRDQDHVPMIVRSEPRIPDRSTAIISGSDAPLRALVAGVRLLEGAGADMIAIPCNTAHYWYDALRAETRLPIIHIVDAVRRELMKAGVRGDIAVMATRGTILAEVYQRRLGAYGGEVIIGDETVQSLVDRGISSVKGGLTATPPVEEAVLRLLDAGASKVVLACTELPIALAGSPLREHCIDATLALARDCVAASLQSVDK
jgi:aspartate racemase